MRDAALVASLVQALLGSYLGVLLWRGATTRHRRLLARVQLAIGGYGGLLALAYATTDPIVDRLAELLALFAALLGFVDLVALGAQLARKPSHTARGGKAALLARAAVLLPVGVVTALGVMTVTSAQRGWPAGTLVAALLAGDVASIVSFGCAWKRGSRAARSYLFAALWPLAPLLLSLGSFVGLAAPQEAYRLIRDLSILAYEIALLLSYLDHGEEPMSLRDRIVAGVLAVVLSLLTAAAHVLLPLTARVADGGAVLSHAGTVRLMVMAAIACALVGLVVPRTFRRNLLAPLDSLAAALAEAERGARIVLSVEHRDEVGRVTESFNRMVAALADGREALAGKVRELEQREAEVVALNEELGRQIAARSRQLADALREWRANAEAIAPGATVDGRYRIEAQLGAGGMGQVYAARRVQDGKELALKVITSGSADGAVRFMREAELAAKLSHENLVSVLDVGLFAGTPYFVMERLEGGSLADVAGRFGELGFVLPLLAQVARGLDALHARGVLHRDLKPANVLLSDRSDRPIAKIADFGIAGESLVDQLGATLSAEHGPDAAATTPAAVMGTLPYIAPELAAGPGNYAAASDVFALGVLAWEVLGAGLPFRVPAVVLAMSGEPVRPPSADSLAVPRALADAVTGCLAPAPGQRPTVQELARAFEGACPAPP